MNHLQKDRLPRRFPLGLPHRGNAMLLMMWLLLCVPASAELLYIEDTAFAVENRVLIQQSADKVWQTLVQQVDDWWPKDHSWWGGTFSIEAHAGGCFCERQGEQSAQHMMVSLVDPGVLLRMTGGLGPLQGLGLSGTLDWQLTPEDGNSEITLVTLTYRVNGYMPGGFSALAPIVDQVQALQLGGLHRILSTPE